MNKYYINLENPLESDIQFKVNYFPDGQESISFSDEDIKTFYKKGHFYIIKSICCPADLMQILSCVSAIKAHTKEYSLYAPYILGSRSDRKFNAGGDMYLDEVMLPILNMCNFKTISTIDFHCHRNEITTLHSLKILGATSNAFNNVHKENEIVYVFPDESAYRKNINLLNVNSSTYFTNSTTREQMSTVNYIYCVKTRNEDGTITQTMKKNFTDDNIDIKAIYIIDDIFDGGRSYMDLALNLREQYSNAEIIIKVSHLIGSNKDNLEVLEKNSIKLHATNSYTPFFHKNYSFISKRAYTYKNIEFYDVLFNYNLLNSILP